MAVPAGATKAQQNTALGMSTFAFTVCFAVWTIFSIIGVKIQADLGLSDAQLGLLVGTPILTGSLVRVLLGIWTDQVGGRVVFVLTMLLAAVATWLLSYATSYEMVLLAALGLGLAGGSFAVGVAYVSKWYPTSQQGTALGIFGAGNVGAAVTKLAAPFVMVAFGWPMVAQIWAGALVVTAVIFWFTTRDDPDLVERRTKGIKAKGTLLQLEPLKNIQVWRFSLYYFFVFGAFVALSLWLPRYLMGVYGLDIKMAGLLAAAFSIPASLFRVYGGYLSDRYGARAVMYVTFGVAAVCTFMLAYPQTDYVIHGVHGAIAFSTQMDLIPFVMVVFVLGFFMSLGKAAVYKHIPVYYPGSVGAVGGLVGMIGGLGGFILPIAFGVLLDVTGLWTSSFMLLFGVVMVSLLWMHFSIRAMEKGASQEALAKLPQLPEMQPLHRGELAATGPKVLEDWRPEDPAFWQAKGKKIAARNLWISIPNLLLAFAVWMVWSVVIAKLPSVGFKFTTDELFWLAALPGLSGATLRIFYSFMVPIFGGRLWTTLTTASLIIPAMGIGYAVQSPDTPYLIFLVLALLCGFGGGNFASSMSNISFFFPKREKGNALALNAGLGNLGVSVMQFLVPLVITIGVFGAIGGEPQAVNETTRLWLQNAGFIWVPFLIISALAAWFGMHDIASAKASLKDQAVIFGRAHNWLMCWLYTGTFGSFIGYSAGFPLLAKIAFPEVNSLQYVFLGPLVGALARAGTGWISDRWGGARVTFWTFVLMIAAVGGVLYFMAIKEQPGAFWGFFAMFMVLFLATGIGNASTFQMIPVIMRKEIDRLMPELAPTDRVRQADKESAAIIGFTSAVAAYGMFFIPRAYGTSIQMTGDASAALWAFLVFYVTCLALTWFVYTRRGGLLHDIERSRGGDAIGEARRMERRV
ncbi:MFS transporter [Devosia sp. 66-22]|jgi:NNP family nitrate/nitrite transporter-like MFS transporter|uniref:nitrate/nitrite transporter n=1 Tax=Devosia sp. 66-22 TaxID=1895753 RepID=UPI00092CBA08|nr:MFS transporter [Devosia sp. 66-22]OJX47744.1 MAG: MFS transporter [Devosia sp. 66-22]